MRFCEIFSKPWPQRAWVMAFVGFFATAVLTGAAHAQSVPQADASAAQTQPAAGPNAVTRAAVAQNILKCAARVEQVSNFLGFSANAGAYLMAPAQDGDNRIAPLVMEVGGPEGVAYVTATFAANQANGCGATYDAVMYWPKNCEAVASQQFEKLKRLGMLKKDISVLDGGASTKVFLMPAGSGCLSIKKEVVL